MHRKFKVAISIAVLSVLMVAYNNMGLLDSSGALVESSKVSSAISGDARNAFHVFDSDNKDFQGTDRGPTFFFTTNAAWNALHTYPLVVMLNQLKAKNPSYKSSYLKRDDQLGFFVGPFYSATIRDSYATATDRDWYVVNPAADINDGMTISFSGQANHVFVDMIKAVDGFAYTAKSATNGDLIETYLQSPNVPESEYLFLKCVIVSNSTTGKRVLKSSSCDLTSKPYFKRSNEYAVIDPSRANNLASFGRFRMQVYLGNSYSPFGSRVLNTYVGTKITLDPVIRRFLQNFGNPPGNYLIIPEVGNQSIIHTGLSITANADKTKPFKLSSTSILSSSYIGALESDVSNDPRTKRINVNGDIQLLLEVSSTENLAFGLSKTLVRIKCYSSSGTADGRKCRIDVEQQ